jgi:hypothetical protein
MNALARIDFSDGYPRLLLVDFGGYDVSQFKDEAGIIHLENHEGKLVIVDPVNFIEIKGFIDAVEKEA